MVTTYKAFKRIGRLLNFHVGGKINVRVSGIDKAFGATFIDIEGLKFVTSLAYRKKGSLYVYIKGEKSSAEEVQKEIDGVFKEVLGISSGDVQLKERRAHDYCFTVLNEKNVKNAFAKLSRKFKSETAGEEE